MGVPLIKIKIAQAQKLTTAGKIFAEVAGDTAISYGSKKAKGEEITPTGVFADVLVGQASGKALGKVSRSKAEASPEAKMLDRAADRAERIADNPKVGRPDARRRQADEAQAAYGGFLTDAEIRGGAIGSNTGQKLYELTNPPTPKKDDQ